MKMVNSYDDDRYFNGVIPCQESPLEPGVYLIPAKFVDGNWVVVASRAEQRRLDSIESQDAIDEKNMNLLISQKIRDLAIASLKTDGMLDGDGIITDLGKTTATSIQSEQIKP
jgi:hypothetical protein